MHITLTGALPLLSRAHVASLLRQRSFHPPFSAARLGLRSLLSRSRQLRSKRKKIKIQPRPQQPIPRQITTRWRSLSTSLSPFHDQKLAPAYRVGLDRRPSAVAGVSQISCQAPVHVFDQLRSPQAAPLDGSSLRCPKCKKEK